MIKFKIIGEDYTLGNILQDVLLKDKRVKGAGVRVLHPLKKEVVMSVFLRDGNPMEVVKESIGEANKNLNNIAKQISKILDNKSLENINT